LTYCAAENTMMITRNTKQRFLNGNNVTNKMEIVRTRRLAN